MFSSELATLSILEPPRFCYEVEGKFEVFPALRLPVGGIYDSASLDPAGLLGLGEPF